MRIANLFVLTALLLAITILPNCDALDDAKDVADALEDLDTSFPSSYVGTWVDDDENELIVSQSRITYNGSAEDIEMISRIESGNLGEIFSVSLDDDDNSADYYMRQPNPSDELVVSTLSLTQSYLTYTRSE